MGRFRDRYVTIFKIGTAEGGSLQLWKRYLGPRASIIAIDIDPACRQVEEEQISVRIGSQADAGFIQRLVQEFVPPDIVLDDGSHHQDHTLALFDALSPHVAKNGVHMIEDVHTAYWAPFGGGLRRAGTIIERARAAVDEINAAYTAGELPATPLGERTTSISFYDSAIVFEVGERRPRPQGHSGDPAMWRDDWKE